MSIHQNQVRGQGETLREVSSKVCPRKVMWTACWGVLLTLLVSGCPANMVDGKRMGRTFDRKISNINEREEALEQKIQEAEHRIEKLAQQTERAVREARARLSHDIGQLRDDDIPKIHGRLEENAYDVQHLRRDVDNLIAALNRKIDDKVNALHTQLSALIEKKQDQLYSRSSEVQEKIPENIQNDLGKAIERLNTLGQTIDALAKEFESRLEEQDAAIQALTKKFVAAEGKDPTSKSKTKERSPSSHQEFPEEQKFSSELKNKPEVGHQDITPDISKAGPPDKPLTASEISRRYGPSVFTIMTFDENNQPMAIGSGFALDSDGTIATNYHVLGGSTRAVIKTPKGGRGGILEIIKSDPSLDLLVASTNLSNTIPLPLGDSEDLTVGEEIFAIGNPAGLEGTISKGIISGIRNWKGGKIIQITAPISPGSSGGPVFNKFGEVIGVATKYIAGAQNLNFAMPSSYLLTLKSTPIKFHSMTKALPKFEPDEKIGVKQLVEVFDCAKCKKINDKALNGVYFSLRNQGIYEVKNIKLFFVYTNRVGEVISYSNEKYGKTILPKLALQFDHSHFVSRIHGGKVEIRILDFEINKSKPGLPSKRVQKSSQKACQYITAGMTPSEVRDLLGTPEGEKYKYFDNNDTWTYETVNVHFSPQSVVSHVSGCRR